MFGRLRGKKSSEKQSNSNVASHTDPEPFEDAPSIDVHESSVSDINTDNYPPPSSQNFIPGEDGAIGPLDQIVYLHSNDDERLDLSIYHTSGLEALGFNIGARFNVEYGWDFIKIIATSDGLRTVKEIATDEGLQPYLHLSGRIFKKIFGNHPEGSHVPAIARCRNGEITISGNRATSNLDRNEIAINFIKDELKGHLGKMRSWFDIELSSMTIFFVYVIESNKEHSWKMGIHLPSFFTGGSYPPSKGDAGLAEPTLTHLGDIVRDTPPSEDEIVWLLIELKAALEPVWNSLMKSTDRRDVIEIRPKPASPYDPMGFESGTVVFPTPAKLTPVLGYGLYNAADIED